MQDYIVKGQQENLKYQEKNLKLVFHIVLNLRAGRGLIYRAYIGLCTLRRTVRLCVCADNTCLTPAIGTRYNRCQFQQILNQRENSKNTKK